MVNNIPYFAKEIFEFRSISPLQSVQDTGGWYLVQILFLISSISTFNKLKNQGIKFEPQNMIQAGWFRMFLYQNQSNYLLTNNLANLYPIIREKSILYESDLYLVYAHSDFKPNINYSRIDDNLFVVSDISQIKADPHVLKITPHLQPKVENRFAGGYSQTGNEYPSYQNQSFIIPRPLHQLGLAGEGQIVSVADSGLDPFHCSFFDPSVPIPWSKVDHNHRKLVLYDPVADDKDPERGHGTHVCGIIAGKSLCRGCGLDLYDGMAPEAKIYMHDLGDLRSGPGDIRDINLIYFLQRVRYVGSHISSNSWGYPSGEEEVRAAYSRAAYSNSDIIFIFAAGNSYNSYTIHTPGNSKNVLTVGALTAPYGAQFDNADDCLIETKEGKYVIFHSYGPTVSALIRKNSPKFLINNEILKYDLPSSQYAGKIVYFPTEVNICSLLTNSSNHLIDSSFIILSQKPQESKCDTNVPVYYYTGKVGFPTSVTNATISPYFIGPHSKITRLPLSSKGPSNLGYTKPEIVATGQLIQSACAGSPYQRSQRPCDPNTLVKKSGTSMAAPVVSGTIAMIRQYFVEGWYPHLSKNKSFAFTPSSALLRAFAINSAKKVESMIETGYGVMVPYESLGFTGIGIRIVRNETISSSSHHIYRIKVTKKNMPLTVTISYLDPPLPASTFLPLFADLDLIVIGPNGKSYNGNEIEDQFATTEKVTIDKATEGVYGIHILSSKYSLPIDAIYSIVVNGGFDQEDFNSNPTYLAKEVTTKCPQGCKKGQCTNGICVCNNEYYGTTCNQRAAFMTINSSDINLKNKIVNYYSFKLTQDNFSFTFTKEESQKIIYCLNFEGKALKLSHPNQNCFSQNRISNGVSFNTSDHPLIKTGNIITMSLYAVTADTTQVTLSVNGVETHFSFINWFVHLPLWMIIAISSLFGTVVVLTVLIFLILKCTKKTKKKRPHKIDPNPVVPEQDPNENLSIEENIEIEENLSAGENLELEENLSIEENLSKEENLSIVENLL